MAKCGSVLGLRIFVVVLRALKGLSRWFPTWFRADAGAYLFKQDEIAT